MAYSLYSVRFYVLLVACCLLVLLSVDVLAIQVPTGVNKSTNALDGIISGVVKWGSYIINIAAVAGLLIGAVMMMAPGLDSSRGIQILAGGAVGLVLWNGAYFGFLSEL